MKLVPKKRGTLPSTAHPVERRLSQKELASICELALMGKCVPVSSEWIDQMTYYLLGVLSSSYAPGEFTRFSENAGFSILKERIRKYDPDRQVTHVTTCMVYEMPCIVYALKGEDIVDPFKTDYGCGYPCATCYVFNPVADDCSEMGDCFFEKRSDGFFHRVS